MFVAILGRQSGLSFAELESHFGAKAIEPIGDYAALVDADEIPFEQFGGLIKVGKLLNILKDHDFNKSVDYIARTLPDHLGYFDEHKVHFGLSAYGFDVNGPAVSRAALTIKKRVRSPDKTLRVIENKTTDLNAAQVLNNRLLDKGMELLLICYGPSTILVQTTHVQNIDAYAARDHGRPKRDARVGMLPPKLAQIMINLAAPKPRATILDPFCGTGVVLQEALLMGHTVIGTDIDSRMIEYSQKNLEWLKSDPKRWHLEPADATTHTWESFATIVSEAYLGRPFSALPQPAVLDDTVRDVDTITSKFLQNAAHQMKAGMRMVVAVPAWRVRDGFRHLPLIDHLTDLGYTRQSFVHARDEDLVYHREGQVVARELLVLIRK